MFELKIIPNAKFVKIEQQGNTLKVHLTAPPEKGKANEQLIEVLSEHFSVKKSSVVLVSGAKSRKKFVEIIGK